MITCAEIPLLKETVVQYSKLYQPNFSI